jgi:hypothetical protein
MGDGDIRLTELTELDEQIKQASERTLLALLNSQTKLRRATESELQVARGALERIGETLVPAELDDLRKRDPEGVSTMPLDQLVNLVMFAIDRIKAELDAFAVGGFETGELAEMVLRSRRNEALVAQIDQLKQQLREMRSQNARRGNPPPWMNFDRVGRAPDEPAFPIDTWPEWANRWQKDNDSLDRDMDLVVVLGDTGVARRQDVAEILGELWGIKPQSGSISRCFDRNRGAELIETLAPRRTQTWRPGHLIRLTDRGEELYRLIRGEDPLPAQTTQLLARHKSTEHAALNVEAAWALWDLGYKVDLFPDTMDLDIGRFYPDLTIISPDSG